MKVTIDGQIFEFQEVCTILEACKKVGIDIPNLCYDPRTEHFTSCYLCVVEVEGAKGLLPSCDTRIRDGLVVRTNTPVVRETRKMCLELLLSDHAGDCVAPCNMNCPAGIDVQAYLASVANNDYAGALRIIKEHNPLPVVCGRVCPKPCEADCRRGLIDEAVAIDSVKRYVADLDANKKDPFIPELAKENNKKVAIIGAGPAGLSCAYYLRIQGYTVDVYEATQKPGGMLMWGIPEYRLPKKNLLREIEIIQSLGINIHYNKILGKDLDLTDLKNKYNAVFVAIGAQKSSKMQVLNEDAEGVYGGVDFLADVEKGIALSLKGKQVIVVGGGNTAIDAARTSVRLGADKVTIVYRRTREEMPAEPFEVSEADHEGVELKFLRAPIEVIKNNNKVSALRSQVMVLGEPDASGRRKPIAVEGKEEVIDADVVIAAIGQYVDTTGIQELELTKWKTIKVDETNKTYKTNLDGVFAGGDVVSGPYIAIGAIAHGLCASKAIDSYLSGKPVEKDKIDKYVFSMGKKLSDIDVTYIPTAKKVKREKSKELSVKDRITNFKEVEFTFSEAQAINESKRCLSCGCMDYDECKLRMYSDEYSVVSNSFSGAVRERKVDESSEYMVFDSTKCIKCGKCVRVCDELKGIGALGFIKRGFFTDVVPARECNIVETSCVECGQCEVACPSGAILDKPVNINRLAQFETKTVEAVCKECSLGCNISICYMGDIPIKITPQSRGELNEPMLCKIGRYEALKDHKKSFKFDVSEYEKLKLYDACIKDLDKTFNEAGSVVVYNVDIFADYAPASYYLKKILDKDNSRSSNICFYFDREEEIYALKKYSVNVSKDKEATFKFINKKKNVLVFVDETQLDKKELDFFINAKKQANIKIVNLVKRVNI